MDTSAQSPARLTTFAEMDEWLETQRLERTSRATPRAGHRVAQVQGLRSSAAAGVHRPAKSGRSTVRRAAIDDGVAEAIELGFNGRGVRF